ncbi:MAG: translation initiation factor [Bacteroidales bacterium]|nr:translation initiation factor [Bacteroidales bacterium]MBQ7985056.1 translation initiation factor [Bacteroidales bacterium]
MKKLNSLEDLSSLNIVYSTDPDFDFSPQQDGEPQEKLPNDKQTLYISLDKKQRAGKKVTKIENFIGNDEDLTALSKFLKTKCGVGGSAKDGVILIQGDVRDKAEEILHSQGFKTKRKGG